MGKYEIKNKNRFSVHSIKIPKDHINEDLDRFLKQSASRLQEYFHNLGIVIDLEDIKHLDNFNEIVSSVVEIFKNNNFIVSGFSNGKDSQKEWLNSEFNVCIFHETAKSGDIESSPKIVEKIVEKEVEKEVESSDAVLGYQKYEGIVRGGQQLYAKGCHLLVVGDVKPNGEVIADGDIIILGKLNGKAIAGASDNEDAIISASEFKASIISIAGNYRQFEENSEHYGKNVKLILKNEKLIIENY